jgi:hypothetical protein
VVRPNAKVQRDAISYHSEKNTIILERIIAKSCLIVVCTKQDFYNKIFYYYRTQSNKVAYFGYVSQYKSNTHKTCFVTLHKQVHYTYFILLIIIPANLAHFMNLCRTSLKMDRNSDIHHKYLVNYITCYVMFRNTNMCSIGSLWVTCSEWYQQIF